MARQVRITTGCRLHVGLLSFGATAARQFGGAGLMLESPGFEIVARPAAEPSIDAPAEARRRVELVLRSLAERRLDRPLTPCAIEVRSTIPPHAGLGSGTQLALGVARAVSLLAGESDVGDVELARRTGRGRRSAIGIHGFQQGGFLVDGGRRGQAEIAPLVARLEFPSGWRLLLATPENAGGLSGADETAAFDRLPPMPAATTAELCRLLVMELLPAVAEADYDAAGDALFQYGRLVGEHFALVQGGVYATPLAARLVEKLRRSGIRGVGQSSWGPTIFGLLPDEEAARRAAADVADRASFPCRLSVAAPLNRGARIGGDVSEPSGSE